VSRDVTVAGYCVPEGPGEVSDHRMIELTLKAQMGTWCKCKETENSSPSSLAMGGFEGQERVWAGALEGFRGGIAMLKDLEAAMWDAGMQVLGPAKPPARRPDKGDEVSRKLGEEIRALRRALRAGGGDPKRRRLYAPRVFEDLGVKQRGEEKEKYERSRIEDPSGTLLGECLCGMLDSRKKEVTQRRREWLKE
jgi:hypothetical protein